MDGLLRYGAESDFPGRGDTRTGTFRKNSQKKQTMYFGGHAGIWILSLLLLGVGMLVSMRLRVKFRTYGKMPLSSGLSGKEIAEQMLGDYGILGVQVQRSTGFLSDHYDPVRRTVNLSPEVYEGRSVASAAVAAHECGHAVQHAQAYSMLKLRSALVPAVQFSSRIVQWVLLAGVLTLQFFPGLLLAGVVLFGLMTLFSLITLPVEFDASKRALAWLNGDRGRITMSAAEHAKAKDALWWAAMTYVVAAVQSVVTLLYYLSLALGGRSRN